MEKEGAPTIYANWLQIIRIDLHLVTRRRIDTQKEEVYAPHLQTMIVAWIPLLLGLLFGLIPPKLLITSECRYLRFEGMWRRLASREPSAKRRRRWWKLPLVWVDPIRGYFVGMQLTDAFDCVQKATVFQRLLPMVATFIVMFVVLWVQTSGRREADETLSPSAFLGGMMIAMLPLVVALSAIVIGISTAVVMHHFAPGYIFATLATAGFGYLFLGRSLWLPIYTVLVASPLIISWIRRTSLVMPVRC
jgi:hypothetical protein